MNKVKYYHVTETGLVEGTSLGRLAVVLSADFDRLTAERDALQLRLNTADQRADDLEQLLSAITSGYASLVSAGCDRITALGGDCDGVQKMLSDFPEYGRSLAILRPAAVTCQYPQSCTTRCDCDIPDFSPGNGNKARRRAESILGFKIVEDPTLAPGEIRLTSPKPKCPNCLGDSMFGCATCAPESPDS